MACVYELLQCTGSAGTNNSFSHADKYEQFRSETLLLIHRFNEIIFFTFCFYDASYFLHLASFYFNLFLHDKINITEV